MSLIISYKIPNLNKVVLTDREHGCPRQIIIINEQTLNEPCKIASRSGDNKMVQFVAQYPIISRLWCKIFTILRA